MIRIDTLWLCTQPQDMRAGADRLLNAVVNTLGAAHAHHGYLFANARASRIKLLVHDGHGVWCATRRLHQGHFKWLPHEASSLGSPPAEPALRLSQHQFEALVMGLPWQRLGDLSVITRC
jgi:transposase